MKHVFDRDFDLEAEEPNHASEQEAYYSAEDVNMAVDQALREGFETGHAEGWREAEAALAESQGKRDQELIEGLSQQIGSLIDDADTRAEALERQALAFVLAVAEKIAPELIARRSSDRVEAEIRSAIALAVGTSRLRISLPPALLERAGDTIEGAAVTAGHKGRIEVVADTTLVSGEARVEWDNGFMEYSFSTICDRILTGLRQAARKTGADDRKD